MRSSLASCSFTGNMYNCIILPVKLELAYAPPYVIRIYLRNSYPGNVNQAIASLCVNQDGKKMVHLSQEHARPVVQNSGRDPPRGVLRVWLRGVQSGGGTTCCGGGSKQEDGKI